MANTILSAFARHTLVLLLLNACVKNLALHVPLISFALLQHIVLGKEVVAQA